MVRYLETFFRHRVLTIAPLVLCIVLSLGVVAVQPGVFASTAKIWVDRPLLTAVQPSNAYLTPADEQTLVLQELLKTRSFSVLASARGSLPNDLRKASAAAAGEPINRALALLPGQGSRTNPGLSRDRLDNLVFQTITTGTTVVANGPNIVSVTFRYANSAVAAATAQGILDQYIDEVLGGQRSEAKAAIDFYSAQVSGARADLSAADGKVLAYLDAHPEQRLLTAVPDASLTRLKLDDDQARQRYLSLQTKLDDAKLRGAIAEQSTPNGFRLIDPPLVPQAPVSRLKQLIAGGAAGLFSGLVLSVVCLVGLTLIDTSIRRAEDVELRIGLRLAGVVPRIA
jgi:uncharacterized protein involved in exopolysaccharide biosynthesis